MRTVTAGEVKAGRREWIGLAVLALPTFIVAIDIFVMLLALPKLTEDLGADSNQQLWITDIYGFLLAGFTVTLGTLGDRIGRRKMLLIGAAAFGVLSVVTAYSQSPEMLIVSRALLGIAGATLMPSTLALIANLFQDPVQRGKAFGLWGGTFTLGMIVGPIIGGVLLAHFWWGSVFLLAVPLMAVLLVVGPKVLPEYKNGQPGRLDPPSVVLSLLTMLPIIYGIKELARNGWEPLPVISLAVGLVAGIAFGRRQGKLADPLLDLSLFTNRKIGTTLAGQLSYSTVGGGVMLMMMLYFQLVHGLSTMQAGLAMIPGMAGATLGFSTLPKLATKVRPAYVIAAGMAGVAICLLAFTTITATSSIAVPIVGFTILSFCGSPMIALGMNLVIGSAPPEKAGSAGSLAQMCTEFGGTLGAAVLGTIGFAVYRSQVADGIPAGIPADSAALAHDSLVGAVGVASTLPGETAGVLLTQANRAFAAGLDTVAGVGGLVVGGMAILIAVFLRQVPPVGQAEPGTETDESPEAAAA
jgi:DHA2 family multidrug resistance protein-like MFS transporter